MPYAVTCKACGARFSVADDLYKKRVAGKSVLINCKQCRAPIRIDASVAPPARRSSARPPSATRQFPSRPPVPQGPARPAPSRLPSIQRTHLGGLTARGAPPAPGSRAAQPPTANAPAAPAPRAATKATLQGLTAPRAGSQAAAPAPKAPQAATKATLQGLSAPKAAPSPPRPRGNLPLIPQVSSQLADAVGEGEGDEEATIPFGGYYEVSEELESVPPSAGPNSIDLTDDAEALPPSIPHTTLLGRGREPHPPLKAEPGRKTSTGGSLEDDPDFLLGLDGNQKAPQDDPPTQRRGSGVIPAPHAPSPPAPPVADGATPKPIVAVAAAASPPTATPVMPTPSPSGATTAPAPAVSKPLQMPSAAPKPPPGPAASRTPQAAAETLRLDAVKLDAPRLDAPSLYDKGHATSSALALPSAEPPQSKRSSWGAVAGLLVLLLGLGGVYRYLNPSAEPQAASPAQPPPPEPLARQAETPPAEAPVAEAPTAAAPAPEAPPDPAEPASATPEPAAPAAKPAAPSFASPSPPPSAPRAAEPSRPTSVQDRPAPAPATTKPSSTKPPKPTGPVGPFDRAAAASALSSAASQASSCKKSGDPSGTASVTVTFAPSGRVTSANISGPPFAGTATGGCIASTLRRATVPPFEGDRITVSKTVVIR